MGQLYRLDFPNGKSYVGVTTKTAQQRLHGHRCRAKVGNTPLYTAWRKHGEPKLVLLAILENCDLFETEIRAVSAFGTATPKGYNSTPGGDRSPMLDRRVASLVASKLTGRPLSLEHKAALSLAQRDKPRPALSAALKGKRASPETRARMSSSAKALKRSEQHIQKLRLNAAKARSVASERRKEKDAK